MATIEFTGNITEPELRFTASGKAVLSLSVAENHRKRDQSGTWQDDGTTWWRVTAWERQAEALAEHLKKGDRVLVTGQVRSREYEKDGEKRTSYDVTARHVAVIPRQPSQGGAYGHNTPGPAPEDPWGATGAHAGAHGTDEPPF